jgi:acyl-CoA synthetase (NDP forming)
VTAQIFNQLPMFRRVLQTVLADPKIDQVIVYNASIQGATAQRLADELADIAKQTDKPMLIGSSAPPGKATAALEALANANLPCFPTPGRAASAAASLNVFWGGEPGRAQPAGRSAPMAQIPPGTGALSEHDSKKCLAAYGIASVREVVLDVERALTLREPPLPFPVVVKIDSPDLPHKSEAGAVRVNIRALDELHAAVREMLASAERHRPGARIAGISVQEMARGTEILAGAVNDRYFGPVVVFGLGGVFTEVLHEVVHEFAPFDEETARRLVLSSRGAALFEGVRGLPPLDLDATAAMLSRLSWLIADHADRIGEIDINPVFVRANGQGVVAADALVVMRDPTTA